MKSLRTLLCLSALVLVSVRADPPKFPGLQAIMSEADWNKARLDRLDAADLQLVNAAFAQYLKAQAEPQPAPQAAPQAAVAAPTTNPDQATAPKSSLWSRFGLGKATEQDSRPAVQMMQARVKALRGANGFVLDNGQVWEGIDIIRHDLAGREIGIQEGRFGSFLLVVEGKETNVRLRRLK